MVDSKMTDYFKIAGGYVYDPTNGIAGQVHDIWIQGRSIVPPPTDPHVQATRVLDAAGLIVMPGGIDIHCHIAGAKANHVRILRPEERRGENVLARTPRTLGGTMGSVPTTYATGYKYAGLGYTTAFDAAVPPLTALHTHEEFADTPCLDRGFYTMLGNNHFVMQSIAKKQHAQLRSFVAWLMGAAKAYGVKIVNPGGVEAWKQRPTPRQSGLDQPVGAFGVTARQIVRELANVADELGLPHPVHLHCNDLGMPGNWRTTLDTMHALEGRRGHLAHVQFHSYAGTDTDESTISSGVAPLAEFVNGHQNVTVDVGQVLFGNTTSATGDGAVGYFLANLYGTKWFNSDGECESGCGIVPIRYRNKSLIHAWQWAIGLEWFLLIKDPWKIALSTDHPNGGSFLAYPQVIRLLMDRGYRAEILKSVHPLVARSTIASLDREYTLDEIATITRAGPARMLGLSHKGHLGPGADADITIYTPHENKQTMFELPRFVIKSGKVLVEQGDIRTVEFGSTLHLAPEYDQDDIPVIRDWFEHHYTKSFRNYPVPDHAVDQPESIRCVPPDQPTNRPT